MFNKVKNFFMKKNLDYQKEMCRGTIKQIMKVRGLRTISLANYLAWKQTRDKDYGKQYENGIHSIKLDVQDGYMNVYGYNGTRCGNKIDDASGAIYQSVFAEVNDLLNDEHSIPSKIKRNILVKLCR